MAGEPAGGRSQSAGRQPEQRLSGRSARRSRTGAAGLHPTQKPVALVRRPIDAHTRSGEIIYEPFAGSATALIAAEASGRRCYALELSPAFCDDARSRWERFAGKQAIPEARS